MKEFEGDIRRALAVWLRTPALPVLSLIVGMFASLSQIDPALGVAALPVGLFSTGLPATERLWYKQVWESGQGPEARWVWKNTWHYFWPFFGLALMAGLILAVPGGALYLGFRGAGMGPIDAIIPTAAIVTAIADVWLTFVTPALTMTRSVGTSLRIGWRMLKAHGRRALPYIVVPPLAALMVLRTAPEDAIDDGWRLSLLTLSVLLNLLFKGATMAYFLRHAEEFSLDRGPEPAPSG